MELVFLKKEIISAGVAHHACVVSSVYGRWQDDSVAHRGCRFRGRRWNIVVCRKADFFFSVRERLIDIIETVSTKREKGMKENTTERINKRVGK
jgi:hypothetical protein